MTYMRRLFSVLAALLFLTTLGLAQSTRQASPVITTVSAKGHRATRHHAHKATKHRAPKHHRSV